MRTQMKLSALTLAIAALYGTPALAADAAAERKESVRLKEVAVSAEAETGGAPQNAVTATRTDTPLRDIPQSIQVIDEEFIEEQNAIYLKDVLPYVSNVGYQQGEGARDDFIIRGFTALDDVFKDGVRDDIRQQYRDLANVERVEVLKGPSAALFGRGSSGGIINLVTKKPTDKPVMGAELMLGSYDLRRGSVDFGGPLASDVLGYRFNAAYERSESFRDNVNWERFFIAPTLGWRLTPNTSALLQFEYLKDNRTPDRGVPAVGDRPAPVPVDTFLGEPFDKQETEVRSVNLTLDHRFSAAWSLRNVFRYADTDVNQLGTRNGALQADQRTLSRFFARFDLPQENYFNQTEALYKAQLGGMAHQLLFGLELGQQSRDFFNQQVAAPSIDIYNPVHTATPPTFGAPNINSSFTAKTVGLYLQDQIAFTSKWKALLGGRFDYFDQHQDNHLNGTDQDRIDREWSPRVGLVFQPTEVNAFYANFSRSFLPSGNGLFFPAGASSLEPESSTLYEVGNKNDFLDGRLSATLALFQLSKENIVTGSGTERVQIGEQRHRGIELDVTGELLPRWDVRASFALLDAEITESRDGFEGDRPANAPERSGSLWSTYTLPTGFGLGGGVIYMGDRLAPRFRSTDAYVTMPSFVRTDATLFYKSKHFDAGLNFRNIFDETYYESASLNSQIAPGAPFNVLFSLRGSI